MTFGRFNLLARDRKSKRTGERTRFHRRQIQFRQGHVCLSGSAIRPLASDRYPRIPPHSFRPLRKKTTPRSRQPNGTVELPRRVCCVSPLGAPVCSLSGPPTWFSCLFDLTLLRGAHPAPAFLSASPGSRNILRVSLLDPSSTVARKRFCQISWLEECKRGVAPQMNRPC